ncbi:MAG: hypothetical protein AABY83_00155 [Pseudomonadota bacterium]|mgnify:CR=1 FL=1
MNKRYLSAICAGLWLAAPVAQADPNLNTLLGGAQAQAQAKFNAFAQDMAALTSYKAITPAEPLGITGFDVSAELTITQPGHGDQWASVLGLTSIPFLPSPKLHAHKGLPFGFDIAAVYMPAIKGISYWGGELRYALLSGNIAMPAIAVRGAYTQLTGFPGLDMSNTSIELGISKGFLMLTPFASVGMVMSNGKPTGTIATVLTEEKITQMKYAVGANLNLGLMNFGFEWDMTGSSNSYNGKFGFRW